MVRWIFVVLVSMLAMACDKSAGAPKAGGTGAKPPPAPSGSGGEEAIVPPPDKPGYAKPE